VGWLAYLGGLVTGVGASALVWIVLPPYLARRRQHGSQAGRARLEEPGTHLAGQPGERSRELELMEGFAAEALRALEIMRSATSWPTSEDPRDAVREAAVRLRAVVRPMSAAAGAVERVTGELEALYTHASEAQTAVRATPSTRVNRTLTLFALSGSAENAIASFAETFLQST
jgi:hypothetical protein